MSKLEPSSNWANEMLMKLVDECRSRGLRAPNFQECSDRRGKFLPRSGFDIKMY